jgi:hypothetical protein
VDLTDSFRMFELAGIQSSWADGGSKPGAGSGHNDVHGDFRSGESLGVLALSCFDAVSIVKTLRYSK